MSSTALFSLDDNFVPQKAKEVREEEIVSRFQPRRYLLIDKSAKALDEIDIKDYFLWTSIDGKKDIAGLKQAYYAKFKTLPTEHIVDLIRSWLLEGFLDCPSSMNLHKTHEKSTEKKRKIIPLPKKILRFLSVPLKPLLSLPLVSFWILLTIFGGLGLLAFKGTAPFAAPFREGEQLPFLVLAIVLGFPILSIMRLMLRLAAQPRGIRYDGDRVGFTLFAFCLPRLYIEDRGLKGLPWEQRLMRLSGVAFIFPALALAVLWALEFSILTDHALLTPAILQALRIFALVALFDFIIQSSPFFEGLWIRILGELSLGASVRRLAKDCLHSWEEFMEDRPSHEKSAVLAYFVSLVLWVTLGGSVLMTSGSRLITGLLQHYATQIRHILPQSYELVGYASHAPILLVFLFLLLKMLQPAYHSLAVKAWWNRASVLLCVLILSSWAGGGLYLFFPLFFGRSLALAALGLMLRELWKKRRTPNWLAPYPLLWTLSLGAWIGALALENTLLFPAALSLIWTVYFLYLHLKIAPSALWRSVALALSALMLLLFSAGAFAFFGWNHGLLLFIPASLALGFMMLSFTGQLGVHFLSAGVGFLLLGAGVSLSQQATFSEALILAGIVSLYFFRSGLCFSLDKMKARPESHLHLAQDAKEAINLTLTHFYVYCWGERTAKFHTRIIEKSGLDFLRHHERWLGAFLSPEFARRMLKLGLAAVPWKGRADWSKLLPSQTLLDLEKKSALDLKSRVALLKTQMLFNAFNPNELVDLAERLEPHLCRATEALVEQGDSGRGYLDILVRGTAFMLRENERGQSSIIALLSPGDAVRSSDLLKTAPYNYSVVAAEKDVLTLRLYGRVFSAWCVGAEDRLSRVLESGRLVDMVSSLSLFRDFSPTQARLIVGKLKRKKVKEGEIIIQQGDEGEDFYLLSEGKVDIEVNNKQVAHLGAGSYFGEIALIQKCLRTATVRAASSCVLYFLEKADFESFFSAGRGAQVLQNISEKRKEANSDNDA